jgi:hypothetical protein
VINRHVRGHHLPQLGRQLDPVVYEAQGIDDRVQVAQLGRFTTNSLEGVVYVVPEDLDRRLGVSRPSGRALCRRLAWPRSSVWCRMKRLPSCVGGPGF